VQRRSSLFVGKEGGEGRRGRTSGLSWDMKAAWRGRKGRACPIGRRRRFSSFGRGRRKELSPPPRGSAFLSQVGKGWTTFCLGEGIPFCPPGARKERREKHNFRKRKTPFHLVFNLEGRQERNLLTFRVRRKGRGGMALTPEPLPSNPVKS